LRTPTRWRFDDPALLYLFPASYFLHLVEESMSTAPIVHWGVPAHRPLMQAFFLTANASAMALMLLGIRLVRRGPAFHWIVPALATAVLLNTLGHLSGSLSVRGYSAGLVTAVVMWIPLGLLTLLRTWDQAPAGVLRAGVAAGAAIELIVTATLPFVGAQAH
jgi:hypothetical protein